MRTTGKHADQPTVTPPRTKQRVEAEIVRAYEDFLAADLADDGPTRDAAEKRMNRLLEEHGLIPKQRLPSDLDGHTRPGLAR